MVTQINQTISQKSSKIKTEDQADHQEIMRRDPVVQPVLALDPYIYNEVEYEPLDAKNFSTRYLCLKE